MSKLSLPQLERKEVELLSQLAGEEPGAAKLSNVELARRRVALLTLILENGGVTNPGSPGTPYAEAYGPTAQRPTDKNPGFQYFDTDEMALLVWDGDSWLEVGPGQNATPYAEAFGPTADRPVSVQTGFQYFDTDLMQLIIWDGADWQPVGQTSSPSSLSRQTVVLTTPQLEPGARAYLTAQLGLVFAPLLLVASHPTRTRLYATGAARLADEPRPVGNDPAIGIKQFTIWDVVLPHAGVLRMAEQNVMGSLTEDPATGLTYVSVENQDAVARAISVTIHYLTLEPYVPEVL